MSQLAHPPTTSMAGLSDTCVRDYMTGDPVCVRDAITVREAAASLEGRVIGAVLVVNDDGQAVGVLSRSDVLKAVCAGKDEAPVGDVMSPAVIAVRPDADARQAAVLMVRCGVQRVFVVEEDGVPVGVLRRTDLLTRSSWRSRHSVLRVRIGTPDAKHCLGVRVLRGSTAPVLFYRPTL